MDEKPGETSALRARLDQMEARLATLEAWHAAVTRPVTAAERAQTAAPKTAATAAKPATPAAEAQRWRAPARTVVAEPEGSVASRWMAGGAAVAFLLAAVYLLRVVYDSGWLTPAREVGLAVIGGSALIAIGLWLARFDKAYAAWLPAAGSVVLFVAAYGAHLYFGLIDRPAAIAAVAVTSVVTLWLGRRFSNGLFALFAVLGVYLFPLWLPRGTLAVGDLAVYFAAWSLVFAAVSLQEGRRLTYVLAMYSSLLGFQLLWLANGQAVDWPQAVLFQLFQFALFAITAVAFSIHYRRGMDQADAAAHGIALFYFYAFEYSLLRQHAPDIAGIAALGSALFVLATYLVARARLPVTQRSHGAVLASAYCALVTTHIVFFEWMPDDLLPWAALLAPVLTFAMTPLFRDTPSALWPVRMASGVVFLVGFLAALVNTPHNGTMPMPDLVLFVYALVLYLGYAWWRSSDEKPETGTALLFAGHLAAMLALARALDSGFAISVCWAALALAALAIAVAARDKELGRSSLLIFAASGVKTLLFDLQGSDSLLRVFTLLVVGASLYAGGWLYQRVFSTRDPETSSATNPPGKP
ncbi:MAG: DUF2339 domain-containing protein [Gammaproteobacteria bacterium]